MIVLGDGPIPSRLMIVGEAPGRVEVEEGRPFVGPSGAELNRFLNGVELPSRSECYVTNVVKEHLPNNRDPLREEIELWLPTLLEEIAQVNPVLIVALGATAARALVPDFVSMDAAHGIPMQVELDRGRLVVSCFHPAAALRSPDMQSKLVYDMTQVAAVLRGELRPAKRMRQPVCEMKRPQLPEIATFDKDLGLDTEGTAADPWCFSFGYNVARKGHVVRAAVASVWAPFVLRHRGAIVLHNALWDLPVLRALGIDLVAAGKPIVDTMVMAHLLGVEPRSLKDLARRHLGIPMREYADVIREAQEQAEREWLEAAPLPEKIKARGRKAKGGIRRWWAAQKPATSALVQSPIPEVSLDSVPEVQAADYAGTDAVATICLYPILTSRIETLGLGPTLALDLSIVPMLDRMQSVGMRVDRPFLEDVVRPAALGAAEESRDRLREYAGRPDFNPASSEQVARLVFDDLRLGQALRRRGYKIKRTKGGRYSTSETVLAALRDDHPVVDEILTFRELVKLVGAYIDGLLEHVHADGRLYPRLSLTGTATGRLTAKGPNLLALPKHSGWGKLIRLALVADPGCEFGEWDLQQIELKVYAVDAEDDVMLAAIREGRDLHRAKAAEVRRKPESAITDEERFRQKAINFGTLMGIEAVGLMRQLYKQGLTHTTLAECEHMLLEARKGAGQRYIERRHAEARRFGYVRNMFGRVRFIGGIASTDRMVRAEAERQAQAASVQSAAQDVEKMIMRDVWPLLPPGVEPILQIHDALILQYPVELRAQVDHLMRSVVGAVPTGWPIPVTCSSSFGERLGELG